MGHDGDIIGMGIVVWVDGGRDARVGGFDVNGPKREWIRQGRDNYKYGGW